MYTKRSKSPLKSHYCKVATIRILVTVGASNYVGVCTCAHTHTKTRSVFNCWYIVFLFKKLGVFSFRSFPLFSTSLLQLCATSSPQVISVNGCFTHGLLHPHHCVQDKYIYKGSFCPYSFYQNGILLLQMSRIYVLNFHFGKICHLYNLSLLLHLGRSFKPMGVDLLKSCIIFCGMHNVIL